MISKLKLRFYQWTSRTELKIAKWCWRKLFHKYSGAASVYVKSKNKNAKCTKWHRYAGNFSVDIDGNASIKLFMDGVENWDTSDISQVKIENKTSLIQYNF